VGSRARACLQLGWRVNGDPRVQPGQQCAQLVSLLNKAVQLVLHLSQDRPQQLGHLPGKDTGRFLLAGATRLAV
jgi:hypothetical protein